MSVTVAPDFLDAFNAVAPTGCEAGKQVRAIIAEIVNEKLVEKTRLYSNSTPKSDLDQLSSSLQNSQPVYILYVHKDGDNSTASVAQINSYTSFGERKTQQQLWTFVSYVPHDSSVRSKFIYGSSKNGIVKQLGEGRFARSVFITSQNDVHEIVDSKIYPRESVMTDREKFDVELRKVEQEESLGARYGQSIMGFVRQDSNSSVSSNTSNASSMKKPKGINWADGVEDAVKSVMEGSISTLQLTIDMATEVLKLAGNTTLDLPLKDPIYVLTKVDQTTFFVYSCPTSTAIKPRTMFSLSVTGTVHHIKWLGIEDIQRIETSDPTDVTIEWLREKAKKQEVTSDQQLGVSELAKTWGGVARSPSRSPGGMVKTPTPFIGNPQPPSLEAQFSRPRRPGRR